MQEDVFQIHLASLKTGCIIFGALELLIIATGIYSVYSEFTILYLLRLILAIVLFLIIFFMYNLTSKKNKIGPILEIIFGSLILLEGFLYCFSDSILAGVIIIAMSFTIFKEALYFRKNIQ